MILSADLAYVALAVTAFAICALLVPGVMRLGGKLGFVDHVQAGKLHAEAMVRGGGVAIFVSFMLTLLLALVASRIEAVRQLVPAAIRPYLDNVAFVQTKLLAVLAGATLLFVVGVIDDRVTLRPVPKLMLQILSAVPLILAGITIKFFIPGQIIGAILTIAWIVLLTNAFNFIDNMNGLSAGVAAICALNFFFVSRAGGEYLMMAIFAIFIGAICGFLSYNFPRARLFMGDAGSLFVGYMLAALSTLVTYYDYGVPTQVPVIAPLLVLGVPIFDTLSVLYIRWRNRKPLMQGDHNHFSHRLVRLGFSRTRAVMLIWLLTFSIGLTAVNLRSLDWFGASLALLQTVLLFVAIFLIERARPETGANK